MADMQGVKKYLSRVRHIDKEIDTNQTLSSQFHSKLTSIKTSSIKDVNVQESQSETIEDRMAEHVDLEEKIDFMIDDMVHLKKQIYTEINNMDDRVHKSVLIRRYVISESWEQIAESLCYSRRHITVLHGSALQEFYEHNQAKIDKYLEKDKT